MNLNEFISHIKHRSLGIYVFGGTKSCKQYFFGDVGTYTTSIVKNKIGSWRIVKIEPIPGSLNIFLEEE